jgi:cystathionine beta-synthase
MQVHESLIGLIGNTPLVRLRKVTRHLVSGHARGTGPGPDAPVVLAKVEYMSPGGSVKDRIALRMVEAAEASGQFRPGGTIVEPTSGNTGVGLAIVAAEKSYKCVFVCPDKVASDKISVLRAYGAEVVVCPTTVSPESPDSYYSVSDRLAKEIPGAWELNPVNRFSPPHHGPGGLGETDGRITHFVAGIGTGGTISGTGRYLKEVSGGRVFVIGADPEGSVYSGGTGRPYLVEGVGEDFWPQTYDKTICDQIIGVSDADSFQMTRRLACGNRCLSAALAGWRSGALKVAEQAEPDAVIVSCCPTEDAATYRRCSTTTGWPTTDFSPQRPRSHGSLTCSIAREVSCRCSCTRIPARRSGQ